MIFFRNDAVFGPVGGNSRGDSAAPSPSHQWAPHRMFSWNLDAPRATCDASNVSSELLAQRGDRDFADQIILPADRCTGATARPLRLSA
jgi:hypothetical protein